MKNPAVSVIMAVYNREEYLEECVRSILDQSFTDFEFVIVNDASTDPKVATTLDRLAKEDSRIRILTNEENKERSYSRNRALHAAKAPYVAVMDSDDVAFPERLAKQYAFMQAYPHVTVCASQEEDYVRKKAHFTPRTNDDIRANTFFGCSICHSAVLFRKEPVMQYTQGYDESAILAEDYDLWVRLSLHSDVYFHTLPDMLMRIRRGSSRHKNKTLKVSHVQQEELDKGQSLTLAKIHSRLYAQLGIEEPNLVLHKLLSQGKRCQDSNSLHECGKWMHKVLEANEKHAVYNKEAFAKAFLERWGKMCYKSLTKLPSAWNIYKIYRPKTIPLPYIILQTLQTSIKKRLYTIQRRFQKKQ